MALKFGFFNWYFTNNNYSYTTEDVSSFFSGAIDDGVFMSILVPNNDTATKARKYYKRVDKHYRVTPILENDKATMRVNVETGKAWFNDTWNFLDADIQLDINASDEKYNRYSIVVLEVDKKNKVNTIKVVDTEGFLDGDTLDKENYLNKSLKWNNDQIWQHPLAYIRVGKGSTGVRASDITNTTGFSTIEHIGPEDLSGYGSQQVLAPAQSLLKDNFLNPWREQFNNLINEKAKEFYAWWDDLKEFFNGTDAEALLKKLDEYIKEVENSTGITTLTVETNKMLIGKTLIAHNNTKEYDDITAVVKQNTDDETKGTAVFKLAHIGEYKIHDGHNASTIIKIPYFGEYWTNITGQGCCLYGFRVKKDSSDPSTAVEYLSTYINNTDYTCMNANYEPIKYTEDTSIGYPVIDRGGFKETPFFMPTLVMLNEDGSVAYKLDQNDITKTEEGFDSYIDDYSKKLEAMAAFPLAYSYRVEKDGYFYCYISDEKIDDNFTCWPFYNSKNEIIPYFYHAMALTTINSDDSSTEPRSLYGQEYNTSVINDDAKSQLEAAEAKYADAKIWSIESNSDIMYMLDLLVLLTKNINIGSVLGCGGPSSMDTYIGKVNLSFQLDSMFKIVTNQYKFYSNSYPNVIFGIESFFGYTFRHILGRYHINGKLQVKNTYGTIDGSTKEGFDYDNKDIAIDDWVDTGVTLPEGTIDKEGEESTEVMVFKDYNNITTKDPWIVGFTDSANGEWVYGITCDSNYVKSTPIIKYNILHDYCIELSVSIPKYNTYPVISSDGYYILQNNMDNTTTSILYYFDKNNETFSQLAEISIRTDNVGGMCLSNSVLYILSTDSSVSSIITVNINTGAIGSLTVTNYPSFTSGIKILCTAGADNASILYNYTGNIFFMEKGSTQNGYVLNITTGEVTTLTFPENKNFACLMNYTASNGLYASIYVYGGYANADNKIYQITNGSTITEMATILNLNYDSIGANAKMVQTHAGSDIYIISCNKRYPNIKVDKYNAEATYTIDPLYDYTFDDVAGHKEALVMNENIYILESSYYTRKHTATETTYLSTFVAPYKLYNQFIPVFSYSVIIGGLAVKLFPKNSGNNWWYSEVDDSLSFHEYTISATTKNFKFAFQVQVSSSSNPYAVLITDDLDDILYMDVSDAITSLNLKVTEQPIYGYTYNNKMYLVSNNYLFNVDGTETISLNKPFAPTIIGGIINNKIYGIDSNGLYTLDITTQKVTYTKILVPDCTFVTAAVLNDEIWFFQKNSGKVWKLSLSNIDFYNKMPTTLGLPLGNQMSDTMLSVCYCYHNNHKYIFMINSIGKMQMFDIENNVIYSLGKISEKISDWSEIEENNTNWTRFFCTGDTNLFGIHIIYCPTNMDSSAECTIGIDISLTDETIESINASTKYTYTSGYIFNNSDEFGYYYALGCIVNTGENIIFRYRSDGDNKLKIMTFAGGYSTSHIISTGKDMPAIVDLENPVYYKENSYIYLTKIQSYTPLLFGGYTESYYSTAIFKFDYGSGTYSETQIAIDTTAPTPESSKGTYGFRYSDCKVSLLKGQYIACALDPIDRNKIYYFPMNKGEYIYYLDPTTDTITKTDWIMPIQDANVALSDDANKCIYLFTRNSGDRIYKMVLEAQSTKFEFRYITGMKYSDKGGWMPCAVDNTKGSSSTYYCSVLGNYNAETITGLSCIGNTDTNIVDGEEVPLSIGGFNTLINPGRQFKAGSMLVCRPMLTAFESMPDGMNKEV